jgi:hypothetical protein
MGSTGFASFDAQTQAFRLARNVLAVRFREHLPADELSRDLLAAEVLPAVERVSRGLTRDVLPSEMPAPLEEALLERSGSVPRRRTRPNDGRRWPNGSPSCRRSRFARGPSKARRGRSWRRPTTPGSCSP